MLKKLLAVAATLLLATGLSVIAVAGPAAAHHNTISVEVECNPDLTYKVTWTVENSERDKTETITASSDTALVPINTVLAKGESKNFVETMTAPQQKKLTLSGKWSNNATNTDSKTLYVSDFPDCVPNRVPVTICHATPPETAKNGWNRQTVDDDSIVKPNGHDSHAADIIPAFSYWGKVGGAWKELQYPGKKLTTVFSGFTGAQILAAGCGEQDVTPVAPTFTAAMCTAPGVASQASYTIPSTPGVTYQVKINSGSFSTKAADTYPVAIGTKVTVETVAAASWIDLEGTDEWTYTFASPGDCVVTTAPVAPTVAAITVCGTYGSITMLPTLGVSYSLTTGNGLEGAYVVTATPADGYKFAGASQSVTFSGNLGTFTTCATPVTPTYVTAACTPDGPSNGSYTIPTSVGVQYQVQINDGAFANVAAGVHSVSTFPTTVTVKATPKPGYSFTANSGPWVLDFQSPGDCLEVVAPVAPTVVDIDECGVEGSVTFAQTEGVVYAFTVGDGKRGAYTVTATPASGFKFDGNQSVDFSGNVGEYTECATLGDPTFLDAVCTPDGPGVTDGSYTIIGVTGVRYEIAVNDGTPVAIEAGTYQVSTFPTAVTIKAYALPGYTLTGTTTWSHSFASPGECIDNDASAAVTITAATCEAPEQLVLGTPVNATWGAPSRVSGPGDYAVTATAVSGHAFDDALTTREFTGTLADKLAPTAQPCLKPELTGSVATGVCEADAPWIYYDVKMTDPNNLATSNVVKLTFTKGADTETIVLGTLVNGELKGKQLWPGATVAADGVTPTGWPGWEQVNGKWVATDGNFGWTRSLTTALLSVNPELTVGIAYPPATPNCDSNPPIELPTHDLVMPTLSHTQPSCTAAGSYTIGGPNVAWLVDGQVKPAGTYSVNSTQTVSFVASAVSPHGLESTWVAPAPIKFTKPSIAACGTELTTLALTGVGAGAGLTLAGGIVFIGIALILFGRRRFLSAD